MQALNNESIQATSEVFAYFDLPTRSASTDQALAALFLVIGLCGWHRIAWEGTLWPNMLYHAWSLAGNNDRNDNYRKFSYIFHKSI